MALLRKALLNFIGCAGPFLFIACGPVQVGSYSPRTTDDAEPGNTESDNTESDNTEPGPSGMDADSVPVPRNGGGSDAGSRIDARSNTQTSGLGPQDSGAPDAKLNPFEPPTTPKEVNLWLDQGHYKLWICEQAPHPARTIAMIRSTHEMNRI